MRSPRTLLLGRAPEPLPLDNAPARHRRPLLAGGRHRQPPVAGVRTRRLAVALLLVLASAGPASVADRTPASGSADPAAALTLRQEEVETASRSTRPDPAQARPGEAPLPRAAAPDQSPPPPEPEPEEEEEKPAEEKPAEEKPAESEQPDPVGGLDQQQMDHAATIVEVGKEMGLPEQAYVVALATALQESYLRVLASTAVPDSHNYPNDGVGSDHDSVGLFQQRPSMGWGTVADCMDPATSARAFFAQLQQVSGWQDLPITVAAQTVQVSAFPDHYAKHEPLARELVAALG